jgi:hypothetical protein
LQLAVPSRLSEYTSFIESPIAIGCPWSVSLISSSPISSRTSGEGEVLRRHRGVAMRRGSSNDSRCSREGNSEFRKRPSRTRRLADEYVPYLFYLINVFAAKYSSQLKTCLTKEVIS